MFNLTPLCLLDFQLIYFFEVKKLDFAVKNWVKKADFTAHFGPNFIKLL